jgi:hypothetical protein
LGTKWWRRLFNPKVTISRLIGEGADWHFNRGMA